MDLELKEQLSTEIIQVVKITYYTNNALTDREYANLHAVVEDILDEAYQAGQLDQPLSPFSTFNEGTLPYKPIDTLPVDNLNI